MDLTLSYSSATTLLNCEQKYCHHKVLNTPIDSDADASTKAFDIGKAFHYVLENSNHTGKDLDKLLDTAVVEFDCKDDRGLIAGMLKKYLEVHKALGLTCIKCEYQIKTGNYLGFVDAVMKDVLGGWWIVDLKTASTVSQNLYARLPRDYQLNLYAAFAKIIASDLGLDFKKFKGCRYRVTTKSKAKPKSNESEEAYINRIYEAVNSIDVAIPKESMDIEQTWERHFKTYQRAVELSKGHKPNRNYTYCESYFKPCEFWSQCHGDIFSNCASKVKVNTFEELFNNQLDSEEL